MPSAGNSLPQPQDVLAPVSHSAIFLVLTINAGGEAVVFDLLSDISGLHRAVGIRIPEAHLSIVTGIGSAAWDRLFGGPRPKELHPFREVAGAKHRAVSTPGDLLFHIRAARLDICFELAGQLMDRLVGNATVVDEVHGFSYFDSRDLLGFVDGTENPTGQAAYDAVVVGGEDPDFAGGSYVIVQKYLHDLAAWNALPVEAQERAVGRTKLSDIELSDATKPTNSHVALNVIEEADGTQRQILRDNMSFGAVGTREFGTYFIGYSATPAITELMLQRMFVGEPAGNHDQLLDFSTAITGSLFFVATNDFLDNPPSSGGPVNSEGRQPDQGHDLEEPDKSTPPASTTDGSLGIGSLKRSTT